MRTSIVEGAAGATVPVGVVPPERHGAPPANGRHAVKAPAGIGAAGGVARARAGQRDAAAPAGAALDTPPTESTAAVRAAGGDGGAVPGVSGSLARVPPVTPVASSRRGGRGRAKVVLQAIGAGIGVAVAALVIALLFARPRTGGDDSATHEAPQADHRSP